jgi:hypothetical protein
MMKEYAAYDNLPAKQSRWELSLHNARDLSWMQQPAGFGMRLFWKYRLVALISLRPFEGKS